MKHTRRLRQLRRDRAQPAPIPTVPATKEGNSIASTASSPRKARVPCSSPPRIWVSGCSISKLRKSAGRRPSNDVPAGKIEQRVERGLRLRPFFGDYHGSPNVSARRQLGRLSKLRDVDSGKTLRRRHPRQRRRHGCSTSGHENRRSLPRHNARQRPNTHTSPKHRRRERRSRHLGRVPRAPTDWAPAGCSPLHAKAINSWRRRRARTKSK